MRKAKKETTELIHLLTLYGIKKKLERYLIIQRLNKCTRDKDK